VNSIGLLIRDLNAKFLLNGHDYFHCIQTVQSEIVLEMCFAGDLQHPQVSGHDESENVVGVVYFCCVCDLSGSLAFIGCSEYDQADLVEVLQ
jgi:hypothetical protein